MLNFFIIKGTIIDKVKHGITKSVRDGLGIKFGQLSSNEKMRILVRLLVCSILNAPQAERSVLRCPKNALSGKPEKNAL